MALKDELKAVQAHELMTENYVTTEFNDECRQLSANDIAEVQGGKMFFGIPLDESILLKIKELTYNDKEDRFKFEVGACEYIIEQQSDWYFIGVDYGKGITYFIWNICHLHTLQNICSLLGQHLTFKP